MAQSEPTELRARSVHGELDVRIEAEGNVRLRQGPVILRTDHLTYQVPQDLAVARGNVVLERDGNRIQAPSARLFLARFEGEILEPRYFFASTGGHGQAQRIELLGHDKLRADRATYSSCPPQDTAQTPPWELKAESIRMDFDANEGLARHGVLRFFGVPVLAAPVLSFPITGAPKSGWLAPTPSLDNRSGFEFAMPYYWRIAANRDATLTPFVMTRRGAGLDSEFRYLTATHRGEAVVALLPNDRIAGRSRWDARVSLDAASPDGQWMAQWRGERVSDDDYWKDMGRRLQSQTPRLLANSGQLERRIGLHGLEGQAYLRWQGWQALQGDSLAQQFETPYQRTPQLGFFLQHDAGQPLTPWTGQPDGGRLQGGVGVEYNHFTPVPDSRVSLLQRAAAHRLHAQGHLIWAWGGESWWLRPRLDLNVAHYRIEAAAKTAARTLQRVLPTLSIDQGWQFERPTRLWGAPMLQQLEPRLLYVRTPYREQSDIPFFDAAPRDFNADSIYAIHPYTGIDRLPDANQLTFGATTRWLHADSGQEWLRLGAAQRYRFTPQRITLDAQDGGPRTSKLSDLLLIGAAQVESRWWVDAALQVSPEDRRAVRSTLRLRYAPASFQAISMAYRQVSSQNPAVIAPSEQIEVAWQWPLFAGQPGGDRLQRAVQAGTGRSCDGRWYSAGRVQYSLQDRRVTDAILGFEYDAGCWIARIGAERRSTGQAEATNRLMFQLELVGLSQLGSNAMKVLRDNVPGYRPLSRGRAAPTE